MAAPKSIAHITKNMVGSIPVMPLVATSSSRMALPVCGVAPPHNNEAVEAAVVGIVPWAVTSAAISG